MTNTNKWIKRAAITFGGFTLLTNTAFQFNALIGAPALVSIPAIPVLSDLTPVLTGTGIDNHTTVRNMENGLNALRAVFNGRTTQAEAPVVEEIESNGTCQAPGFAGRCDAVKTGNKVAISGWQGAPIVTLNNDGTATDHRGNDYNVTEFDGGYLNINADDETARFSFKF